MRLALLLAAAATALAPAACTPPSPASCGCAVPQGAARATTRDPVLESLAHDALAHAVVTYRPTAAVIVVLDASTGHVLAMQGRDHEADAPDLAARRAWVTGSVLKTLTLAAALDAGTIRPDDLVDCATRRYGAVELHDAAPHGTLSVADALAVSSNVGTSRVYDTLGLPRLLAALHGFHIGDAPAVFPVVTDPASLEAAALAGGELAPATPLQVAAAYAALVGGGVYRAPSDVASAPAGPPLRVVRAATAATTMDLLERAVRSDLGTNTQARVPGHRVAGKTGTADLDEGGSGPPRYYASFVGTVRDASPPRVILVGLEAPTVDGAPGTGGTAAAPVFARLAARLVTPPDTP